MAALAAYWAKRRSQSHFSYGYHRMEVGCLRIPFPTQVARPGLAWPLTCVLSERRGSIGWPLPASCIVRAPRCLLSKGKSVCEDEARRHSALLQVLGALASVMTVWLVTGILLFEAVQRIITPEHVDGKRECRTRGGQGALTPACKRVLHCMGAGLGSGAAFRNGRQ